VPADLLVDALWGDAAPASARLFDRSQVSRLRRAVGTALAAVGDGYVLRLPAGEVGATRFGDVVDRARRGRATVDELTQALRLWR
jgi:DNA-binding SARP family transcriptional activator